MNAKSSVMFIAVSMLVAGAAVALPNLPFEASTPPIFDPDGSPFVGPDIVDPCNNNAPAAPQALGFGGNAVGTTTGYHRYANDNAIGGLDACLGLGGVPLFAACAVGTETASVTTAVGIIVGGGVGGLPGTASAAATVLASDAGGVVAGACGGIGGSGTDGEFEYGSDAAFLNVRTTATANGGDGLDGCFGGSCGSTAGFGCLQDSFVSASAHHGTDTTVYVMDALMGGHIGFTVGSDWSRGAATSSSGQDLNKLAGAHHCGDGVLEPCDYTAAGGFGTPSPNTGTAHAGLVNDARQGNTVALLADAAWLAANVPTTSDQLAEWNEYRVGCNPFDWTGYQPPAALSLLTSTSNSLALGALANVGNPGYTGSAAGYLLVFIDDPSSAGIDPWNLNTLTVTPHDLDTVSDVGWVWTG